MRIAHLAVAFLIAFHMAAFAQEPAVQVKATSITIPTYPLGPENPNPPFRLINSNNIYPYTELDTLTNRKQPKTYRAVVLENRYLRATVIPELGARLYSLYDKSSKREVFYRNHVVKYALIGLRGAWISGGVEFSFPNAHTTDTVSLVSSKYEHNSDGSASVLLGDVDRVSGMYWQVRLTLRPNARRLEEHVTLYNATPSEGLYWFWDNSAVRSTPDLHFMYPMREVNPDSRTEFWTYPVWKGVDYSRAFDIRHVTEIFAVDVHRDFFGGYYQNEDFGMVHVADYRKEEGKKIWSWGIDGQGSVWTKILTDNDGPYNELQAGIFQTQLNQDFFSPRQAISFTGYWYPVDHLKGGYVDASKDFALNAAIQGDSAQLEFESTIPIKGVRLTVSAAGKTIQETKDLAFQPAETRSFTIPLPAESAGRIVVSLTGNDGRKLLRWDSAAPIDGNPNFVSQVGEHAAGPPRPPKSPRQVNVQRMFLRGRLQQMEGKHDQALRTFQQLLDQDPQYIPALRKCALASYRGADFAKAKDYIARALKEEHSDPRTQYISGVINQAAARELEGAARDARDLKAEDGFWGAIRYGGSPGPAYAQLGEIALARKDYPQAEALLRKALNDHPHDALATVDLAAALRLNGKSVEAAGLARKAVEAMPLYPAALAEQWRIASAAGGAQAADAEKAWLSSVGSRGESYLDAGSWYWRNGDWPSSAFILKAAIARLPHSELSPMAYYYLASDARHEGHENDATAYQKKAQTGSYPLIFPNRLSDEQVLREAVNRDSKDGLARYLLGTFLFQYGRYAEADRLWSQASETGFRYSVLDRNRGLYQWRIRHDLADAAPLYAKAIQLAPQDYHLYVDLDRIYGALGDQSKREHLFAQAPPDILDQDTSRARYALLLVEEQQYDKALALFKDHVFHPWELGMNIRELFVAANIERGRALLARKKPKEAQQSFEEALTYPANLMVGKPDRPEETEQLYWIGQALDAQGDKDGAHRAWTQAAGASGSGGFLSGYYGALALDRLGEKSEAQQKFLQLERRLNQQLGSNCYYAGLIQQSRGNAVQARAEFERALRLEPSYWPAEIELRRQSAAPAS